MKKSLPLGLSIIVLISVYFLWDYIKLPYNYENVIFGEYYYKKFNPLNETIRFLAFILLPCITYLASYLFINKETYSLTISSKNYFLNKKKINFYDSLDLFFFLFVILISLEFLALNFNMYTSDVDIFH